MANVADYFGSMVFDDKVMKERLDGKIYQKLRKTIDEGEQLSISVANAVAVDPFQNYVVRYTFYHARNRITTSLSRKRRTRKYTQDIHLAQIP